MRLIPGIPTTLVAIKRMEEGHDDLLNSANLCWLFCNSDFSVKGFKERIAFEFKNIQEKNGEYMDPEITSLIVQGAREPEKVASLLAKRLDTLVLKKQVPYAGQIDDPRTVFVSAHLEAARLISTIEDEGFSENVMEILRGALDCVSRCEFAIEVKEAAPWPKYLTVSLKAVGCLLILTRFSIEKQHGEYEMALKSFINAIDRLIDTKMLYRSVQAEEFRQFRERRIGDKPKEPQELTEHDYLAHTVKSALSSLSDTALSGIAAPFTDNRFPPWLRTLTFQAPADCFEGIRSQTKVLDSKALASVCRSLIQKCQEDTPILAGNSIVSDARGTDWEPDIYWYHALGWTEGLLTPSDLRESLQQGEDVAAEKRMRAYFFDDTLWSSLPQRTRRSLVNADRDYFGGANSRKEAILNELKVAAEEILLDAIWKPLNEWILEKDERRSLGRDFVALEDGLRRRRHAPTLVDFEKMCRMNITQRFLKIKGFSERDLTWLSIELPESLRKLRRVRDKAEHESAGYTHDILSNHFNRFMGIGEPGVIVLLARLFYGEASTHAKLRNAQHEKP